MKKLGTGVAVILSAIAGRALAGPAWCPPKDQLPFGVDASGLDRPALTDQIASVVTVLCEDPERAGQADLARAEAARQKLSARLRMTDADWADAADLTLRVAAHEGLSIDLADPPPPWSAMGPLDQAAALMHPGIEGAHHRGYADLAYVADAFGPKLSESARVVYVDNCLQSTNPVTWAMCQGDLDALDGTRLAAELRAATSAPPYARMAVRVLFDQVQQRLAAHASDVKQLVAKDPAYGQLFSIARAERAAWTALWNARPPALVAAAAVDDALVTQSRRAVAGCRDQTWTALAAAIPKLPAKAFEPRATSTQFYQDTAVEDVVLVLLHDREAYLAASAYADCQILDREHGQPDGLASELIGPLHDNPGYRGPRTSAQSEILRANIQLDDRDARIDQPEFSRHWFDAGTVQTLRFGRVGSMKTAGDHATIDFAPVASTEVVDTGCTRSNHVHSIRSDGSIEYEYSCTGSKRITVDHHPDPVTVQARFTHHLGARMQVVVAGDAVFLAWRGNAKVPSVVLGVPVR